MYLEVVTHEDSRVELTPVVVRTCRSYVYTYEDSRVELTPEVVRTCRYYLCAFPYHCGVLPFAFLDVLPRVM